MISSSSIYVSSFEKICSLVEETSYIKPRDFKNGINMCEERGYISDYMFPLFAIKTDKLEPIEKISYFNSYLRSNTKLTIQELKKPEFKHFIFNELKNNKKRSFDLFFMNIFRIVESVIKSWQKI